MRVLLDTCILIDVFQARKPFLESSKTVLMSCATNTIQGVTTAKAITDVYYIMHGYFHDKAAALDIIKKLYKILEVADSTGKTCFEACFSSLSDYEDAVMDETARAESVGAIVTRNSKDFKDSKTEVLTPKQLIAKLELTPEGLSKLHRR